MKTFLFSMSLLLVLVGCSIKNSLNKESENKFIKNDNTNLVFGNSSAKEKFVYIEEGLNEKIIKKLTIYIDENYSFKSPFKFNNCEKSGSYKTIKSVVINKKTDERTPIYKNVKKDCTSFIKLSKPTSYGARIMSWSKYDLNFLEGFNIHDFQGFPLKLALTSKVFVSSTFLNYNQDNIIAEEYDNKGNIIAKSYIYFGDNN